jgi:hypothetical protein
MTYKEAVQLLFDYATKPLPFNTEAYDKLCEAYNLLNKYFYAGEKEAKK